MHRLSRNLTPLLLPLGLLMKGIVAARNGLYSSGLFRQRRLPGPVISVGNLGLGGEGKTPFVIFLASLLRDHGVDAALLSRGYGRLHPERTHIVAPGNQVPSPWKNIGDEPAVIRRYAPELWVGISKNRYSAGTAILERKPRTVCILDDGFQHRSIHRDLDLVIIDCSQNLPRNRIFPAGTLREPPTSLKRAQAIVLNVGTEKHDAVVIERLVRGINGSAPLFHCRQKIETLTPWKSWQSLSQTQGTYPEISSAFLVAAVGNPERFARDAAECIRITGRKFFRDHRQISTREWFECADAARDTSADAILTTEKDAIKLVHAPDFPIYVARQITRVEECQALKSLILNAIGATLEAH